MFTIFNFIRGNHFTYIYTAINNGNNNNIDNKIDNFWPASNWQSRVEPRRVRKEGCFSFFTACIVYYTSVTAASSRDIGISLTLMLPRVYMCIVYEMKGCFAVVPTKIVSRVHLKCLETDLYTLFHSHSRLCCIIQAWYSAELYCSFV